MNLPIEYKVESFEKKNNFFLIFVAKLPWLVTWPQIVSVFSSGKFDMLSEYV